MTESLPPHDSIIAYGDNIRVERTFTPAARDRWYVYERREVDDGSHPVHGTPTTEEFVWVKVADGTKQDCCALAENMASKSPSPRRAAKKRPS